MSTTDIVRAWKDTSFRAALSGTETLPGHPAGTRLVEMDEAQLQNVSGAYGCGWVCSFTSECTYNTASKLYGC